MGTLEKIIITWFIFYVIDQMDFFKAPVLITNMITPSFLLRQVCGLSARGQFLCHILQQKQLYTFPLSKTVQDRHLAFFISLKHMSQRKHLNKSVWRAHSWIGIHMYPHSPVERQEVGIYLLSR